MEKKINKVKCMAGKPINLFEHERLLVIHGKLVTKKKNIPNKAIEEICQVTEVFRG